MNPTNYKDKVKLLHTLVTYARKHKLARVKCGDVEVELTPHSYLTRSEQKQLNRVNNPSPEELAKEEERLLYHSTPF